MSCVDLILNPFGAKRPCEINQPNYYTQTQQPKNMGEMNEMLADPSKG
jgi:hypothetical protein